MMSAPITVSALDGDGEGEGEGETGTGTVDGEGEERGAIWLVEDHLSSSTQMRLTSSTVSLGFTIAFGRSTLYFTVPGPVRPAKTVVCKFLFCDPFSRLASLLSMAQLVLESLGSGVVVGI